ncbi:MAG: ABC transporter substrate-binding protein [bacterium]|nr:ABC transporter substrate-binding protein [bacterium]
MKFRFKLRSENLKERSEVWQKPFLFASTTYGAAKIFFGNLKKSYLLMTKRERIGAIVLLVAGVSLLGYKSYKNYIEETVLRPTVGGEYSEVMVGNVKFLNPVVAQSDAEKSVSKLMFQGLVKITDPNTIVPDAAESYTVSTDGKKYTFSLRHGIAFSDGQPLTAKDVAYTIAMIQAPELKSPLQKTWLGIEVDLIDDFTIEFNLAKAYGPFIYNCDFSIIPSYLAPDDFSQKLTSSGPFQFLKSVSSGGKITEVDLARNDNYSSGKPFLDTVKLVFQSDETDAIKQFKTDNNNNAIFGADTGAGANLNYDSSRELGLIFNLRKTAFKDAAVRQKILTGGKFDVPLTLTIAAQDAPPQRAKGEELKKKFETENLKIKINYYDSVSFQDHLVQKDYDLVLYGFDFGYDRDPYLFWHSSQMSDLNLAGWSDKKADILMEDARMLPDAAGRNAKYDQVFDTIKKNYIAEFYDPIQFAFSVKPAVKGILPITGTQVYSRFDTIGKWYIEEKRVRKQ